MNPSLAIGDNDPVPLETAVREFLPHVGITDHTLRAEIARGRLEHMRIGRRILVTRQMIEAMLDRCRVAATQPKVRRSADGKRALTSAEIQRVDSAQVRALEVARALQKGRAVN